MTNAPIHAAGEPIAGPIRGPAVAPIQPLTVDARTAAKLLSISCRSLWTYTAAGTIPFVRLGRGVLYRVADLDAWLAAEAGKAGAR